MYKTLAIVCAVGCALMVASFFGMCSSLESEVGMSVSRYSVAPAVFALLFGGAAYFFYGKRDQPMK